MSDLGPRTGPVPWYIWYGVLVGPVAAVFQLTVGYLLVTWHCSAGLTTVTPWLHLVSALAVAAILIGGGVSLRAWRETKSAEEERSDEPGVRTATAQRGSPVLPFLALAGVIMSVVFLFSQILALISPIVLTTTCT